VSRPDPQREAVARVLADVRREHAPLTLAWLRGRADCLVAAALFPVSDARR
jgi:hypothetical protein